MLWCLKYKPKLKSTETNRVVNCIVLEVKIVDTGYAFADTRIVCVCQFEKKKRKFFFGASHEEIRNYGDIFLEMVQTHADQKLLRLCVCLFFFFGQDVPTSSNEDKKTYQELNRIL